MRILVACEESQRVMKEFRKLGHEAYSCDILPCSGGYPQYHIQADASQIIKIKWDMIIAFPPCTYLSNAGSKHLWRGHVLNKERYEKGLKAKEFFMMFFNSECPRVAIENPVSSKIYQMPPHTQEIQPYMFGHPTTKKTRLWLKGLPLLKPTNVVVPTTTTNEAGNWFNKCSSKNRSIIRSKTFEGVAKAMAEQWSNVCLGKQRRLFNV